MKIFRWPISVHCWGGLGSQLFAWAIVEKLKKKFPNRKIHMVLHTAGVTKRESEIDFLKNELDMRKINDYSIAKNKTKFISQLTKVFFNLNFIASANSDIEFENLKPWVLMLRGHYSYQSLDDETINKLLIKFTELNGISIEAPKSKDNHYLGIHYRLGDLLSLSSKSTISSDRMGTAISSCLTQNNITKIYLFSDSILDALSLLDRLNLKEKITTPNGSIAETIKFLVEGQYFIGTNSKISIWVIVIRKFLDKNSFALIPFEMKTQIHKNLVGKKCTINIKYF